MLIFSTPKGNFDLKDEDTAPDSNELFRQFLRSDRRKSQFAKKTPSRSQSTPNFAPLLKSVNLRDTMEGIPETPQSTEDGGEERTPVLSSTHKPRTLSFQPEETKKEPLVSWKGLSQ